MKKSYLLLLVLSGCAVGPNYTPPEDRITGEWRIEKGEEVLQAEISENWWELFEDPLLNRYIDQAKVNNYDVLAAGSTILQARALKQMAASSFYPKVNSDVSAVKTYFSKNGPIFSFQALPDTPGLPFAIQVPQIQNLFNFLFDASWEIDLFGKTRRTVEAANAIIGRTIEERNDRLITVIAELALNYIELRYYQKQKELLEENLSLLQQQFAIIDKQVQVGYSNQIDNETILEAIAQAQAQIPPVTAKIYQNIYAISTLTGQMAESLIPELIEPMPLPKIPEKIAIGLKSTLIRRRPDIRRAERNLAAATANIGVAVAQFFPTITLLGDGGLQSLALGKLFSINSRTWAIGGDLNMPIFQGGKLRGNLHAKRAETATACYEYQQTVLKAFEEVEGALLAYQEDLKALESQKEVSARSQKVFDLVSLRFKKGLDNRLKVIDFARALNQSESSLLEVEEVALIRLISLYKALGGGY